MKEIYKGIEKAVWIAENNGGYEFNHSRKDLKESLLDVNFWQALGKAEGWAEALQMKNVYGFRIKQWKHQWHSLIDHLAEGKDIDSFFEQILK